jgi:phosphate-selective porin OprO and OprP
MMGEVRFKWQGFSLLHEMHLKEIINIFAMQDSLFRETTMLGGFVQAGCFPHYAFPLIPRKLELAGRYAIVDPNLAENNVEQQEVSGIMTYFLNGHSNIVNLQISQLTIAPDNASSRSAQRFWVQWDMSF